MKVERKQSGSAIIPPGFRELVIEEKVLAGDLFTSEARGLQWNQAQPHPQFPGFVYIRKTDFAIVE